MNKPKIQSIKRKTPLDLARGLKVHLVGSLIHNPKTLYVVDKYAFKNAVRVRDSAGTESVITQDEIISDNELHQLRQQNEKKKLDEQKSKYADIALMWEQGLRTAGQMAKLQNVWPISFVSRMRIARRLGVIPMGDGSAQR